MKTRLNFTIEEKTSESFKKICESNSVNMSQLIEDFMQGYIENDNYYKTIKDTIDNIEDIKKIASENYNKYSDKIAELDLSSEKNDEYAMRKLLTRINFSHNIIEFDTCRIGQKRLILMNKKAGKLFENLIKGENYLFGYEIYLDDKLGNYIVCMKVLNEDDKMIIELMNKQDVYGGQLNNKNIELTKHHVGFKVIW